MGTVFIQNLEGVLDMGFFSKLRNNCCCSEDPKIVPASPIPTQTAGRCFKCAQLQETKEKTFKLVRNCEYEKWGFQLEEVCDGRIICKQVDKRSVADAAGLKQGDILIKMDSETINGKSQTLKVNK